MKKGYLLIESMVAVTVIMVGLLGIFALLSQSLSLNRVISDRYVATYLAAEGIEIVKNSIDNNVLAGEAWNKNLKEDKTIFYWDEAAKKYSAIATGKKTSFVREIFIRPIADSAGLTQSLQVNSVVNWTSRGGATFSVNLEDHFYNYR